jgi:hypothetical protein
MGRGRRGDDRREHEAPIPLDPVDLLAGLAPGVELQADDLPPGIDPDGPNAPTEASVTVTDAGRMIRAGEAVVRRLIRTPVLVPETTTTSRADDVDRAGVLPRTPDKPGE